MERKGVLGLTKQELFRVRDLKKKQRDLEKHLQELKVAAENIVPVIDGLPHAKNAKSRVERIALEILDCERELVEICGLVVSAQSELADKIMREVTSPALFTFAVLRYVECLSFKDTAHRMRITLRHAFRLNEKLFKCHIVAQNQS